VERLTKKEHRAKNVIPICDLENFSQRVLSRLSKIVPTEIISYCGVNPRRRNACATYPHYAYTPSQREYLKQRMHTHRFFIHDREVRELE
jgi:hypothetical protein